MTEKSEQLDIGAIEEQWVLSYWNDTVGAQKVISQLVGDVKRLREENNSMFQDYKALLLWVVGQGVRLRDIPLTEDVSKEVLDGSRG